MPIPHGAVKLGRPKLSHHDDRTLKFSKYAKVVPALPDAPAEVSWITKVPSWPMYLNDTLGDCVPAAMAHVAQQETFYAGSVFMPLDIDVEVAYEKIGGYVPGDPSTDNGCDMLTALNYWRNSGIGGHRIAAFMALDPKNLNQVRQAIQLFGSVFAGVGLPVSAQNQNAWTVADGGLQSGVANNQPYSWGGHCVPIFAQSPQSLTCVTWGETLKISHNFFVDYFDEAWVVLSLDWIDKNGLSPSAFDYAQLKADLSQL